MMLNSDLYIKRCDCGWQFLSLNDHAVKCPQCRDKYCLKCGETIKRSYSDRYCRECVQTKDIYCMVCDKEKEDFRFPFCQGKTFRDSQESCPHGYDCANCPEPDCILPVDDEQSELF
jgi:hypothetical protein